MLLITGNIYIITSIRRYRDDVSSCIFNKRYLNNPLYINRFSEKIKLRQSKTKIPNLPKTLEGIN